MDHRRKLKRTTNTNRINWNSSSGRIIKESETYNRVEGDNYSVGQAIADTHTKKFLEKIPKFPTDVLVVTISVPPPVQQYIIFDYSGARAILTQLFEGIDLKLDKNSRLGFLIEFEPNLYYTDLRMDIRLIITGQQSHKIVKQLKKSAQSDLLSDLGITTEFVEFSDVSEEQLSELIHPYIPELSKEYTKDRLKIMNRIYPLNTTDLEDYDYKIHKDDDKPKQ